MHPLSRFAAAALCAVCLGGCALHGRTDGSRIDPQLGAAERSKSAGSERNRRDDDMADVAGASKKKGSGKPSRSDQDLAADNPFRRTRPAKSPTAWDAETPSTARSRRGEQDGERDFETDARAMSSPPKKLSGMQGSASPLEPEDDDDGDEWAKGGSPRNSKRTEEGELEAMIAEEIRLAEPGEKADLARDLPNMTPSLARKIIQLRRLARQVNRNAEEPQEPQVARGKRTPEGSRSASRDEYADDLHPNDGPRLRSQEEPRLRRVATSPRDFGPEEYDSDRRPETRRRETAGAPPNVLQLDRNADPRSVYSAATVRNVPDARSAISPLGDASGLSAPPTSPFWGSGSSGGLGREGGGGAERETQQLFQIQSLQNQPPAGSLFNANAQTPAPVGTTPYGSTAPPNNWASGRDGFRSEPAGIFSGGASFTPTPSATTASQPSRYDILPVSASTPASSWNAPPSNPLGALTGLATPTSRADLQRLIAVAEADAATLKLGPRPSDSERRLYIEKHVALRMLYLMAGQQERALQAIPAIDPGDQEFWQQMFWSIANYFDGQNVPDRGHRAALAATQLRTAIDRLQESARLELRNVAFCHKITSFGNYERFDRDEFTPGQPVLMYAELSNFKSTPASGGKYLTRVRSTVEIYNAAGGLVTRFPFPETEDLCLNHRRDYYHSYEFNVPAEGKITLGPHTLKLIVEDRLSEKVAEETLRFTVK